MGDLAVGHAAGEELEYFPLIQVGRSQVVDEPADVGDRGLHFGLELGQHHGRGVPVGSQGVAGRVEAEHDPRECWAEPVVQVTADAAPLFLPRGHQGAGSAERDYPVSSATGTTDCRVAGAAVAGGNERPGYVKPGPCGSSVSGFSAH